MTVHGFAVLPPVIQFFVGIFFTLVIVIGSALFAYWLMKKG